jgi:histidine triad (HIT) family protein
VPVECVFCGIVAGRESASFVHRDSQLVAFMSNAPVNPGHVLVIPRLHASSVRELAPDLAAALFRAAQRLGDALRESTLRCEGLNLFLADGEVASQLVPHVHLHVIPRFAGDSFKLNQRGGVTTLENAASREELELAAAAVRAALAAQEDAAAARATPRWDRPVSASGHEQGRSDRGPGGQARQLSAEPLGGGMELRDILGSLERPIQTHPDQVQQFLLKAARLLSGLPHPALRALEIAERFHRGSAGAGELEAARLSCWHLCDTPASQLDSPEVAALRAAICALYPSLEEPFETVCFFFDMSERCRGPISEQLELLRTHFARPAT